MTLEECYVQMGGDLAGALLVLETPERVERYLRRFLGDPTARLMFAALKEGRAADAFRAAHTLKGLCCGLGLLRLCESCAALAGCLRRGETEAALETRVRCDYERTMRAISALAEQHEQA